MNVIVDSTERTISIPCANPLLTPPTTLLNFLHGAKFPGVQYLSLQGADIDSSVVDGKHNRTGRRKARSLDNSRLIVGSNPTHPIISFSKSLSSVRSEHRTEQANHATKPCVAPKYSFCRVKMSMPCSEADSSNLSGTIAGICTPACAERLFSNEIPLHQTPHSYSKRSAYNHRVSYQFNNSNHDHLPKQRRRL